MVWGTFLSFSEQVRNPEVYQWPVTNEVAGHGWQDLQRHLVQASHLLCLHLSSSELVCSATASWWTVPLRGSSLHLWNIDLSERCWPHLVPVLVRFSCWLDATYIIEGTLNWEITQAPCLWRVELINVWEPLGSTNPRQGAGPRKKASYWACTWEQAECEPANSVPWWILSSSCLSFCPDFPQWWFVT